MRKPENGWITCSVLGLLVGLFLTLLAVNPIRADVDDVGAAAGQFLKLDPSARSAAMGSAMVARPGDLATMPYNPAGIAGLRHREAQFTHNDLYAGVGYDHLAVAMPTEGSPNAWGLSLTQVDYGSLERTRIGSENPIRGLGTFDASDRALAASYARQVSSNLRVGVTGKYIKESIGNESGQTPSADVGLQYRSEVPGLVLGLTGRNLVGNLQLQKAEDPLPRLLEGGAYYTMPVGGSQRLEMGMSVVYPQYAQSYLTAGLQYGIGEQLNLRAGYHGRQDAGRGFTFGGGLQIGRTTVDYAYVPFDELGSQQRITFSFLF